MKSMSLLDRIAVTTMSTVSLALPLASCAVAPPLHADAMNAIRAGDATERVTRVLGSPYRKIRFPMTRTTAWDYHIRDAWGYDADFSVIIDDGGKVVGTITVRNGD